MGLLVAIGIIVVMSILGYLTQLLKRTADRRQQEHDRERERERRARAAVENPSPAPTKRNELDRYIQAVEAQRSKPVTTARPVGRANPVPTVQPVRTKSRAEPPSVFPAPRPSRAGAAADELPMATVVSPSATLPILGTRVTKPPKTNGPTTPLGRQLAALFRSPQAPALAVVLAEVFGPPKCKQNEAPPQVKPDGEAGGD